MKKKNYKRSGTIRYWIAFLAIVSMLLSSCAVTKNGCPNDVSRWEGKHKFNK